MQKVWTGGLWFNPAPTPAEKAIIDELTGKRFRIAASVMMRGRWFWARGAASPKALPAAKRWDVNEDAGKMLLTISSNQRPTCHLERGADGVWRGRWLEHERMPIELIPRPSMIDPIVLRSRRELEEHSRRHVGSAPYGDRLLLCRVLGKYPLLVDTLDATVGPRLVLDGYWEAWASLAVARFVQPGMGCIDVGPIMAITACSWPMEPEAAAAWPPAKPTRGWPATFSPATCR